jgi:alpha,alpha-trehalose phosphorylase
MSLTYGFGGMSDFDGKLAFDPRLPASWGRLKFPIRFHNRQLLIDITHQEMIFENTEGEPLTITVRGQEIELKEGHPIRLVNDRRESTE